jgi:hypothetical protein
MHKGQSAVQYHETAIVHSSADDAQLVDLGSQGILPIFAVQRVETVGAVLGQHEQLLERCPRHEYRRRQLPLVAEMRYDELVSIVDIQV